MQAVYYRHPAGREPVNDFIDALAPERQEEIDHTIGLLNRLARTDPPLPFPHSSQVRGQLRELRCHYGRELYRILYRRSGDLLVLLHIIEKRSKALPEDDIPRRGAMGGLQAPHGHEAADAAARSGPRRTVSRLAGSYQS